MVFGEFAYQLDAKNRFRIPAKLKNEAQPYAYITKGTNGCLFLFSEEKFNKLTEKFEDVSIFDQNAMLELRMFYSGAAEIEEDAQGRVLLPKNLIDFADIKKDIVFIGVGKHIELWAKEKYEQYSKNFDQFLKVKVGGKK